MTYELPHPLDRKGQQEAFDYIMNSKANFVFVQAPTGSGKSAWAAEASKEYKALVLMQTKSLQVLNYEKSYQFDSLMGKSNYACNDNVFGIIPWTASNCIRPKDETDRDANIAKIEKKIKELQGLDPLIHDLKTELSYLKNCMCGDCDCPYQVQFGLCAGSQRVNLNYAKYLYTQSFIRKHQPKILFLDEAHQLPNIVTDYIGITLRWNNKFINHPNPPKGGDFDQNTIEKYLLECEQLIRRNGPKSKDVINRQQWQSLLLKVEATIKHFYGDDWYFELNEEKLMAKPLTAKYHFDKLFNTAEKVVLMSATLNADLLASELGIDEYDSYVVDNAYPAPMRRIWDLDVPKLNWKSTDIEKQAHAQGIAQAIRDQPSSWSGIIHTTSKYGADELSSRLEGLGINTFVPPKDSGTEVQLKEWYANRKPGTMCVAWAFHEGVDLGEDQICIVAKTPYASIKEGYERARVEYNKQLYKLQTAWKLEQSTGRVRRGRLEHYVPSQKFVAIADRSWRGLKGLLSKDFKDAIKEIN